MKTAMTLCLLVLADLAHAVSTEGYFPLGDNSSWIYNGVRERKSGVSTGLFRSDAPTGAASDLVIDQYGEWSSDAQYHFDRSGGSSTRLEATVTPQGTYDYNPAVNFLPTFVDTGTAFSSSGTCGNLSGYSCTYSMQAVVEEFDSVTVKAGKFDDVLRIKYDYVHTYQKDQSQFAQRSTDTIWFAKDVGEVKRRILYFDTPLPGDLQTEDIELIASSLVDRDENKEDCNDCDGLHGDPINLATGNSRQYATDYAPTSRLRFARIYNGRGATRSDLGIGWRRSDDHHVALFDNATPRTAMVTRGDGRALSFTEPALASTTPWLSDSDVRDRLVAQYGAGSTTPSGWLYYPSQGSVEVYDAAGQLARTVELNGQALAFVRDASGLTQIVDQVSGRKLTIERTDPTASLITRVTDDSGLGVEFTYDLETTDLRSAGVIGTGPVYYSYNEGTRTGGADLPHALTTLTGEDGKVFTKWTFDGERRATSSERGSAGVVHSVEYTQPGLSTIRYPNETTSRVSHQRIQGVSMVTQREKPKLDQTGRIGGNAARSFDGDRNVMQSDDFKGYRRCFANDLVRDVETVRVEGLPNTVDCDSVTRGDSPLPSGSRKISTQWHADWRLVERVAEPLKITTYVYNGRKDPFDGSTASCVEGGAAALPDGKPVPVLCKKVEQRTEDAQGAQGVKAFTLGIKRTWSYTYDADGQTKTTLDPVKNKTTYEYYTDASYPDGKRGHSKGDLKLMTNGAGLPTQFDLYDKAGRLLQLTDANGTKTELTYEAHGWLESVKVTPLVGGGAVQLTRYEHYPTGLLKMVTLPDGTTVSMVYDDARRLKRVTDGAGNTVVFTPDEMGNVATEELQNKNGQLAKRVERIYNDLNRLKDLKVVAQ